MNLAKRSLTLAGVGAAGIAGGAQGAVQHFDIADTTGDRIYFDLETGFVSTEPFEGDDFSLLASEETRDSKSGGQKTDTGYTMPGFPNSLAQSDVNDGAARLSAGEVIDASRTYDTNALIFEKFTNAGSEDPDPAVTDWRDTAPLNRGFVGINFLIDDETHYGWADLQVNDDVTFTLYSFAYEDVAGQAITAGAVPEPSTVALLLAGAAGVGAMMRRRKQRDRTPA